MLLPTHTSFHQVSYQDVVRGKPRDGVVSFARPCFYHFRTGKVPTDAAADAARDEKKEPSGTPPVPMEAPEDVSDFKTGLFMLTVR